MKQYYMEFCYNIIGKTDDKLFEFKKVTVMSNIFTHTNEFFGSLKKFCKEYQIDKSSYHEVRNALQDFFKEQKRNTDFSHLEYKSFWCGGRTKLISSSDFLLKSTKKNKEYRLFIENLYFEKRLGYNLFKRNKRGESIFLKRNLIANLTEDEKKQFLEEYNMIY